MEDIDGKMKVVQGNHRCSGGAPNACVPKGAGQNGWDDSEVVGMPVADATAGQLVTEAELSSHF